MSTLRVDNFGPSAGGTTYSADGIAKAWASYNQQTPGVDDSLNVSSITDVSTGRYTSNFTNSFSNTNYYAGGSSQAANSNIRGGVFVGMDIGTNFSSPVDNRATSDCDMNSSLGASSTLDALDFDIIGNMIEFKGDLA